MPVFRCIHLSLLDIRRSIQNRTGLQEPYPRKLQTYKEVTLFMCVPITCRWLGIKVVASINVGRSQYGSRSWHFRARQDCNSRACWFRWLKILQLRIKRLKKTMSYLFIFLNEVSAERNARQDYAWSPHTRRNRCISFKNRPASHLRYVYYNPYPLFNKSQT